MRTLFVAFWLLFWGAGCATKLPTQAQSGLVTFKTKQVAYRDVGFIKRYADKTVMQIYMAGQPAFGVTLDEASVCLDALCYTPARFHALYLHESYPDATLAQILHGEPVFGGVGLRKLAEGFEQTIATESVSISYTVTPQRISFRDRANKIIIEWEKGESL